MYTELFNCDRELCPFLISFFFVQGNPAIFIESTIHSDEWITVTAATYFLNELLTSNRSEIRYLADNFDWIIVPIVNPDGYEYTHTTVS